MKEGEKEKKRTVLYKQIKHKEMYKDKPIVIRVSEIKFRVNVFSDFF